jgi:hypothetical protein
VANVASKCFSRLKGYALQLSKAAGPHTWLVLQSQRCLRFLRMIIRCSTDFKKNAPKRAILRRKTWCPYRKAELDQSGSPRLVSAQANCRGLLILLSLEDDRQDVVDGLVLPSDRFMPAGVFEVVRSAELGRLRHKWGHGPGAGTTVPCPTGMPARAALPFTRQSDALLC